MGDWTFEGHLTSSLASVDGEGILLVSRYVHKVDRNVGLDHLHRCIVQSACLSLRFDSTI